MVSTNLVTKPTFPSLFSRIPHGDRRRKDESGWCIPEVYSGIEYTSNLDPFKVPYYSNMLRLFSFSFFFFLFLKSTGIIPSGVSKTLVNLSDWV